MRELTHYELLADLLEYPEPGYLARIQAARETFKGRYESAASALDEFAGLLPEAKSMGPEGAVAELQEIHTRSFDVQSITTLDVGYVAFGDDYKRGEFLVNLNREHKAAGVACGSELADHLPNLLRLLARWQDPELMHELVHEILIPVLRKMLHEFGAERMEQRSALYEKHYKTLIVTAGRRALMYQHVLAALLSVVEQDFGQAEETEVLQANDFLRSLSREMEIDGGPAR